MPALPGLRGASLPVLIAIVGAGGAAAPGSAARRSSSTSASIVGVNVILAVSLNIVNGMTGQFSIGHAGLHGGGRLHRREAEPARSRTWPSPGCRSGRRTRCSFVGTLLAGRRRGGAVRLPGGPALAAAARATTWPSSPWASGRSSGSSCRTLEAFGRALGLSGIPQTSSLFVVWFWVFLVVLVARRIVGSHATAAACGPSARTRWPPRRWASTPPATRSAPSSSPPSSPGSRAGCSPTSCRSSTRARSPS